MKSVLVIGGGVAGLTAASILKKTGKFDVKLLEASDRIGGRVHTVKTGALDDEIVERGGQWIHGENAVFHLVKKYAGEFLVNDTFWQPMETHTNLGTSFGVTNIAPEKVQKFLHVFQVLMEGPPDNVNLGSVGDWFLKEMKTEDENFAADSELMAFMHWLERLQLSIDGADNWFDSSIRGQMEYLTAPGCPIIAWTKGYSCLFNVILNESTTDSTLPDWIKLSCPVTQIDYTSKPIVTRTDNGDKYESDCVIVTIPLGVLKAKHQDLFKPALSPIKIRTIENLGFGSVNKVHVQFEKPWWDSQWLGLSTLWLDSSTDATEFPNWARSILGFYTCRGSQRTLTGWITGPDARFIEIVDKTELSMVVLKLIKKFTGKSDLPPAVVSVTNWYTNPYTRGSYSYRCLKSEENDVWAKDLATPIHVPGDGILCFGGEATHSSFFSTVHGAYETGVREANRLIELYGSSQK